MAFKFLKNVHGTTTYLDIIALIVPRYGFDWLNLWWGLMKSHNSNMNCRKIFLSTVLTEALINCPSLLLVLFQLVICKKVCPLSEIYSVPSKMAFYYQEITRSSSNSTQLSNNCSNYLIQLPLFASFERTVTTDDISSCCGHDYITSTIVAALQRRIYKAHGNQTRQLRESRRKRWMLENGDYTLLSAHSRHYTLIIWENMQTLHTVYLY